MRSLRLPDAGEIIRINRQQGEDALRFSNDILYIPMSYPSNKSSNVTEASSWLHTSQTSYQLCGEFQTIAMQGCLNIYIRVYCATGGTASFKFMANNSTIWEDTATTAENKSKSFPNFEVDDDSPADALALYLKTSNGSYPAYIRVRRLFLSARPFYSY